VGKKHDKEKGGSRTINVEIAPGNQAALDRHIEAYNARPDRGTPKVKYTDVVNQALDGFLSPPHPSKDSARKRTKGQKQK
jgi:hypothetical protein